MDINKITKKIENLDYWDSQVLYFSVDYFGDEATLVYDFDDDNYIMYHFLACQDINIHHGYKDNKPYKNLSIKQLSMYLQKIEIFDKEGLYILKINAHPLYLDICCKDIEINKIKREECTLPILK